MENILTRGVRRVFDLANTAAPDADAAYAECRMEEAIASLSYTDALRVAVALNDYADRMEIEQRRKAIIDIAKEDGE